MDGLRRFQDDRVTDLSAALRALPGDADRLIVGFSGGRDSTALLDVCCRLFDPARLMALHVCHGLDPNCDDWARFCADRAQDHGVVFKRLDVSVDTTAGGLEAAARAARYGAIAAYIGPGDVFVSAHHADDQAQTVLIQALRGAGMRGLAGMPVWRALGVGRHWRPWLSIAAAAIANHAETAGLDWVDDPSNADSARDRGYLDAEIWPALISRWPAAVHTLSRVGERAAEAREALDRLATIDLETVRVAGARLSLSQLAQLSSARRKEVFLAWCREQAIARPDSRQLAEIERLLAAREHNSPRVVIADYEIRRFDGQLFRLPALGKPPSPETSLHWAVGGVLDLPHAAGRLVINADADTDAAMQALGPLTVVFRRGGERLQKTNGQHMPLTDFLREQRIAPWVRARIPLIYRRGRLVAVADRWRCPSLAHTLAHALGRIRWEHALTGD